MADKLNRTAASTLSEQMGLDVTEYEYDLVRSVCVVIRKM